MNSEIIFDSPEATLWFHPESKIVHHKFHKNVYGQNYRDFFLLGTQLLKERSAHKWLSDDQGNTLAGKDELRWGKEVWLPKTVEAGWKYWAIVQPDNVLGQLNMEKLVKEFSALGIEAEFFSDINEAFQWLESF